MFLVIEPAKNGGRSEGRLHFGGAKIEAVSWDHYNIRIGGDKLRNNYYERMNEEKLSEINGSHQMGCIIERSSC